MPDRTVRNSPRPTVHQIPTAVRRSREAVVYLDLAEVAHAAGFVEITPSQIHEWVVDGLLPRTAEQRSAGRHGFETIRREGVEEQLLALCGQRMQTKSRHRLAILLWLDGWEIAAERVRAAVLSELPDSSELGLDPTKDDDLDKLDEFARKRGPSFARRSGLGKVGPATAADGVMASMMSGLGVPPDEESGESVIRLAGLTRARTDALGGAGPLLKGSTAPPPILTLAAGKARQLTSEATEAEIAAARRCARALAVDLPEIARAFERGLGPNAAGLGVFARELIAPGIAVAYAIYLGSIGLSGQMDEMAGSFSALAAQVREATPRTEGRVGA